MDPILVKNFLLERLRSKKFIILALGIIVVAVALMTALLASRKSGGPGIVSQLTNQIEGITTTANMKLVAGESVDNQGCQGSGPVSFGTSPMRPEDIGAILPYGLMVGAHVTPIDHMYFSPIVFNSPRDSYEVRAMADSVITGISERTQNVGDGNNGTAKAAEYQLKFWYSCDFASYYDLLTSLSPRLQSEFDSHRQSGGQSAKVQIRVKEGELVGKIGGQTVDFSVYDYTKILPGFIVPEHYLAESWKLHVVDPFQYFKEPVRSQLLALDPRQVDPRSGKLDYDIDGKLVGTWFKVGNNGFGQSVGQNATPWRGHLSFVYDYLDPTALVISIGDYAGVSQQFAVKGNSPDPASVSVSAIPNKYELTQLEHYRATNGAMWDGMHVFTDIKARPRAQVQGVALVQMLGSRKIKFEVFPGKTAAQVKDFDAQAILYER